MIKIECPVDYVQPGQHFEWTAKWNFESNGNRVFEASLCWRTHGKGDGDWENAIEEHWTSQENTGSRAFRWQAPRAPLSFNGKLIKLSWSIDFTCDEADLELSHDLQISPTQEGIELPVATTSK